jgi:hypothetical protein
LTVGVGPGRKRADPIGMWQNLSMTPPDEERRQYGRREDRAEMSLGASRAAISNLSIDGAFVSILSGLHPEDTFSFELVLDDEESPPVQGRAVVVWADPGIGVGVRFELSAEERARLLRYVEKIEGEGTATTPETPETAEPPHEPPRRVRRTVALGSSNPGESSTVWFKYLLPERADEPAEPGEPGPGEPGEREE